MGVYAFLGGRKVISDFEINFILCFHFGDVVFFYCTPSVFIFIFFKNNIKKY